MEGSTNNLAQQPAAAQVQAQQTNQQEDSKRTFNYPLVQYCDMIEELRSEAVDMCVTAVEKHPGNYEAASQNIKETMDKKCGSSWHVIVGEGFGFEVTHEMKNLLYMYFGGTMGILVWKAS